MNAGLQSHWREDFDGPWRRLPWIVLLALITWATLLAGFARMLAQHPTPQPPPTTIDARIVELQPPTAGLQGGGASAQSRKAISPLPPTAPRPAPVVKPKPPPVHHARKRIVKTPSALTEPPSPFGTAKHTEPSAPMASRRPATGAIEHGAARSSSSGGIGGGTGEGGLGSDSSGARAMYAPAPVIPDDMRETAFSTVAVARFKVSPEGEVSVTLVKPTPNPRLNQILLDTLRQWKFFPAMKDGVAINSEFEIRIPIAVQ